MFAKEGQVVTQISHVIFYVVIKNELSGEQAKNERAVYSLPAFRMMPAPLLNNGLSKSLRMR
jgi:hypothetical protein